MRVNNLIRDIEMSDAWIEKHYGQLVGWKVNQIAIDDSESNGEPWIGLVLSKGGFKKIAWVLCDSEGNGAGHLDIEDK
jgi:hypothetical protein|tara:strand:- start:151 stop:384 length:234 start_codon:yes stop_codon:yes gene_type:complete